MLLKRIAQEGGRVDGLTAEALLDRSDSVVLRAPTNISPNGSCRIIRTADDWIAVNLPRPDDMDLLPAWLGCADDVEPWTALKTAARNEEAAGLVARGAELGLAVARLGEAPPALPAVNGLGRPDAALSGRKLRVLDLSALWAGPLCGAILGHSGHNVTKVEARTRPDPVTKANRALHERLNGCKARQTVERFSAECLLPLIADADILITSARPRAFAGAGLTPDRLFASKPGLIWVAITAHGWFGPGAGRTGFGDDAAVAGAMVDWQDGSPIFAGDAVADPLTGLAAAAAALRAVRSGGGVLIDAAMARVAAWCAQASCNAN